MVMLPRMTETSILAGLAGFESGTTARSGVSSLAGWVACPEAQPQVPATSRARATMFRMVFLFIVSSLSSAGLCIRSLGDQDIAGQCLERDLRAALPGAGALKTLAGVPVFAAFAARLDVRGRDLLRQPG